MSASFWAVYFMKADLLRFTVLKIKKTRGQHPFQAPLSFFKQPQ
jgi:hypothetical protein